MKHPSDREIRRWLDSGLPVELDDHIGTCDECTEAADRLSQVGVLQWMRGFLAAPDGFEERIAARVDASISRWEAIEAMAGLFTIGTETVTLILGESRHEL